MRRNLLAARGTVERLEIQSESLAGNLLGDSANRELFVYMPAARHAGDRLPLLVDLVGFTGSGQSHVNWKNFGENVPERLDRLIGEGRMPAIAVAFLDCFSRLGGNQYINSAAIGRHVLALGASSDPDPTQFLGIRLPAELDTAELIPERWAKWQAQDPVNMVEAAAPGLKTLRALYIDCGDRDQFFLQFGARRLHL